MSLGYAIWWPNVQEIETHNAKLKWTSTGYTVDIQTTVTPNMKFQRPRYSFLKPMYKKI